MEVNNSPYNFPHLHKYIPSLHIKPLGFPQRIKKGAKLKQKGRTSITIRLLLDGTQKQRILQWNSKVIAWLNNISWERFQKSSDCWLEWNDIFETIDRIDHSIKD